MPVPGADLHFIEAVAHIRVAQLGQSDGLRIVGFDCNEVDALGLVIVDELLDTAVVELRSGAVIAGEDDRQERTIGVIAQLVDAAIDPGEREIRSRRTDRQRRVFLGRRKCGHGEKYDTRSECSSSMHSRYRSSNL